MNFPIPLSRTRFSNGAAKVRIFFKPASVSGKIFDFFFSRRSGWSRCDSLLKNFQPAVSQTGVQRYDFFHYFQIFFNAQRRQHRQKTCPRQTNSLDARDIHDYYDFVKTRNYTSRLAGTLRNQLAMHNDYRETLRSGIVFKSM